MEKPEPVGASEGSGPKVFVTLITAEGVETQAFTQAEAAAAGLLHPEAYNLIVSPERPKQKGSGPFCPVCGLTQKDFEKRGPVGLSRVLRGLPCGIAWNPETDAQGGQARG
jgi:hypothetical protein